MITSFSRGTSFGSGNADLSGYLGRTPYLFHGVAIGRDVYSAYPAGNALLFTPLALIAGLVGLQPDSIIVAAFLAKLVASVLTALGVSCIYLLVRGEVDRRVALYLTFVAAVASPTFAISSQTFVQHGPTIGLTSLALLLVVLGAQRRYLYVAGAAMGLAIIVRPPNALLALGLIAYLLRARRAAIVPFILGMLPLAAFQMTYGWIALGGPFRLTFLPPGGNTFFEGFVGHLVSPSRGLFVYSPFFVVAFLVLAVVWRHRASDRTRLLRWLSLVVLANLILYSWYFEWWGGYSFGNRYMSDFVPIYTLALAEAWRRGWFREAWRRWLFAIAVGWSLLLQAAGAGIYYFWSVPHWEELPDINKFPARLWQWNDSQWVETLWRLVTDPDPTIWVELLVLAVVFVLWVRIALAPDRSTPEPTG